MFKLPPEQDSKMQDASGTLKGNMKHQIEKNFKLKASGGHVLCCRTTPAIGEPTWLNAMRFAPSRSTFTVSNRPRMRMKPFRGPGQDALPGYVRDLELSNES